MWGEEYSCILFPQVVTDLHFCQLLFESMTYVEYFVTDGIPDCKRHTDGTPERQPASYKLGKKTKPFDQLAAAAMWVGSHFGSLEAGLFGG